MPIDQKKLIKFAAIAAAAIISIALAAAVIMWYKKREKSKMEAAKKDLESKWMSNKDFNGIGIILDKYIEVSVRTEALKKEIEATLKGGKWNGAEVKVVVMPQATALKKESSYSQNTLEKQDYKSEISISTAPRPTGNPLADEAIESRK